MGLATCWLQKASKMRVSFRCTFYLRPYLGGPAIIQKWLQPWWEFEPTRKSVGKAQGNTASFVFGFNINYNDEFQWHQ